MAKEINVSRVNLDKMRRKWEAHKNKSQYIGIS
ncbi:hypothetical protein F9Y90_05845 (plasmid) [Borrelia miyamotoi]|uniref:DUF603 domain-containing protein n=1 Tax=Borrelia miyamotoi TaxID=47466 RepID=A0A5P8ARV2_9SPIR|nr:hypothetical protein F9Y90_05845 [Borrelia miyamotoi]